jgi:molybdenum cofactor cytidylyltransferase
MYQGDVVAILTAAGRSSRMGRPKALLEWHGLPLITYQVRTLMRLREVIVILGHEALAIRPFVPVAPNLLVFEHAAYDEGRTSSLLAGLKAIDFTPRGIMVVAVDQPLIGTVVDRLLSEHLPCSPISVPVHQEKRGHPALFRGDLLPELLAISEAREGLREVVDRHRAQRQEVPVEDPGIWLDLNDASDYHAAHAARGFYQGR